MLRSPAMIACASGLIGSSTSLNNVSLNLAGSTSFDNENPTPTSISGANYLWDFGTVSAGSIVMAGVGLNNSSVSFTPGFDASRSVNPTTFTASGTQTLTVNVTPRETLPVPCGISISVNVPEDQYVNATIGSAVTSPNGAPLNDITTTPMNGASSMIIGIDSPT